MGLLATNFRESGKAYKRRSAGRQSRNQNVPWPSRPCWSTGGTPVAQLVATDSAFLSVGLSFDNKHPVEYGCNGWAHRAGLKAPGRGGNQRACQTITASVLPNSD